METLYETVPQYWNIVKQTPNGEISYIPLPPKKYKLYEDSKDVNRQDYYFYVLSFYFLIITFVLIIISYIICYFIFNNKIKFINRIFLFIIIFWVILLIYIISYSYYLFNKSKELGIRVKKEIGV